MMVKMAMWHCVAKCGKRAPQSSKMAVFCGCGTFSKCFDFLPHSLKRPFSACVTVWQSVARTIRSPEKGLCGRVALCGKRVPHHVFCGCGTIPKNGPPHKLKKRRFSARVAVWHVPPLKGLWAPAWSAPHQPLGRPQ